MSKNMGRFTFAGANGELYEVLGTFGNSEIFTVTKAGERALSAPSDVKPLRVLATIDNVENEDELELKLKAKFSGLKDFKST